MNMNLLSFIIWPVVVGRLDSGQRPVEGYIILLFKFALGINVENKSCALSTVAMRFFRRHELEMRPIVRGDVDVFACRICEESQNLTMR